MFVRKPLSTLTQALRNRGITPPPHQTLYRWVLDGRLPFQLGENGRWTYAEEDLPAIMAEVVRLRPSSAVAQQNAA